mmetsp:Transcript_44961/g.71456  ORF Transcript_44961/g.71456 Transcript_44961/m.71456 type:complete len:204 (-) Transcript_44961:30-641(-)
MSYSKGVLIYNFNEDRFGEDLQHGQKIVGGPKMSVSHTVHNWKTPATEKAEIPAFGLDRHVLFGHTGDMRDPHTNLQKSEFTTASQYFLQDPASIAGVGTITADGYTVGTQALGSAANKPNHFVAKMRAGWGDMRQSHALPPNERFLSETKKAFAQPGGGLQFERIPRHYEDFTRHYDAVKVTRSTGLYRGGNLRSAASLMVQ